MNRGGSDGRVCQVRSLFPHRAPLWGARGGQGWLQDTEDVQSKYDLSIQNLWACVITWILPMVSLVFVAFEKVRNRGPTCFGLCEGTSKSCVSGFLVGCTPEWSCERNCKQSRTKACSMFSWRAGGLEILACFPSDPFVRFPTEMTFQYIY